MSRVWSRFPGDSDAAYSAFSEFLHYPPEERPELYEFAREKGLSSEDPDTTRRILEWAYVGEWLVRVAEFDRWTEAARLRAHLPITTPAILQMARILKAELNKHEALQQTTEAPYLDFSTCIRTSNAIAKAEASIDKEWAKSAALAKAGEPETDLTRLSLDELHQWESLYNKARVV